MKFKLFYKNFFIVLGIDLILLAASFYGAHLVRFDFEIPIKTCLSIKWVLPVIITLKIVIFYFFDLYRGMWRYTSLADLFNIIKGSTLSTLIIISIVLFKTRFHGLSRSVFVIDWCLTILFISAFRLSVRLYFERFSNKKTWENLFSTILGLLPRRHYGRKNLIIIGAGDCGEKIYREIRDNARLQYNIVGFLDDDSTKVGKKIHGVPVLSYISDISDVVNKMKVNEALIAIPSASSKQMRNIIEHCKGSDIDFKTIPGMGELIGGKVTISAIREVAYRDLLGREIVKLDEKQIGAYLNGQTVLVTGAGGSIGSELCRQICRFRPKCLVLFERAETPLYEIELELKQNFGDIDIIPSLADVQDISQVEKAFENYRPHTVFHAAAYKHVPMLELQPWKVIDNNILGTSNMVEVSNKFNIERFVFVSTDKAVRPANVMGASKRVAEILVQSQNGCGLSQTRFMIVRFGNVVGSVGSVVPLFRKQIARGGPVTVTDPEVTRYFMTIPEACQLILQTGAMGKGGEIFILKMGTPIKIDDMARDLIRLSGFEPDVDIKIEYIGLRPGEKLAEELIIDGEGIIPTKHEKIMVVKGTDCNLQLLDGNITALARSAKEQNRESIITKLKEIVPEYIPANNNTNPVTFKP